MSTVNDNSATAGDLTINAVDADAPATAAVPAGFDQAVNTAISYFENTFHPEHSVYLNIDFKYEPLAGGTAGGLAESGTYLTNVSYSNVRSHLIGTDAGIPADAGLVLPTGDPFGFLGFGDLRLTHSQEAVIGLPSPDSNPLNTTLDADITLNSSDNFSWNPSAGVGPRQYDAVSTLEHEISEVFGRQCGGSAPHSLVPEPLALFRFDSSTEAVDTTNNIGDYFSINGGQTSLHYGMGEGGGGDLADWNSRTTDCCGFGWQGHRQTFTGADVRVMEALGWKV